MVATTSAFMAGISAGGAAGSTAVAGSSAFGMGVAASSAMTALSYGGTALSLLGTYQTMQQQKYSGEQEAYGYKEQAAQETLKAGEQANLRRDRLLKALAAQNAAAGASGIAGATVESLQLESTEEYKKEQRAADTYSKNVQSAYQRKATAAKDAGKTRATGSLLSGITKMVDIG